MHTILPLHYGPWVSESALEAHGCLRFQTRSRPSNPSRRSSSILKADILALDAGRYASTHTYTHSTSLRNTYQPEPSLTESSEWTERVMTGRPPPRGRPEGPPPRGRGAGASLGRRVGKTKIITENFWRNVAGVKRRGGVNSLPRPTDRGEGGGREGDRPTDQTFGQLLNNFWATFE
jgi:hypothetical protein